MPLCPLWTGSLITAVDNDATAAIHASGSVNAAKRCVCGFCEPHGGTGVLERGGQRKQPTIDNYDDDDAGLCTLAPVGTRGISSARRRDRRGVCAGTNLAQCRVHSSGPARRVVVVVVDEQASKQAGTQASLSSGSQCRNGAFYGAAKRWSVMWYDDGASDHSFIPNSSALCIAQAVAAGIESRSLSQWPILHQFSKKKSSREIS
ncbi:hypothetical protein IWX91DRAFT_365511 [Phyllosticta citricarpa]